MYLLFALFFSLFNVISDPPFADCLDTKKYLLFASFFYVFFSGISDPPLADCLDTKSKQKGLDWIFSLKNYNYFKKIPKLTPFGRRTASGFGTGSKRVY